MVCLEAVRPASQRGLGALRCQASKEGKDCVIESVRTPAEAELLKKNGAVPFRAWFYGLMWILHAQPCATSVSCLHIVLNCRWRSKAWGLESLCSTEQDTLTRVAPGRRGGSAVRERRHQGPF